MQEISFGGKINYDDYKRYNIYHIKKGYIKKFLLLSIAYFMIIYGFKFVGVLNTVNLIFALLLSVCLSGITIFFLLLVFFNRLKKIYNSSTRMIIEQNYEITELGIKCTNSRGVSTITWDDIYEVIEYKDHMIIYTSLVQAIIIPNNFFKDNNDFLKMKNIFLNKLKKEKLKFKLTQ